ncbi:MAG: hypothetical protein LH473_13895 [Chitinophagales bacterium]|nr:hypothetical protein [Chitinophagales bacterium]
MNKYFLPLLFLLSILGLISCTPNPGIGGDAAIKGSLHANHYNSTFTEYISDYPGADTYVYLIFGNDISYGKRIKTTYNGQFEFQYLNKGDYTVYVYSLDSTLTAASGSVAKTYPVTITDRKQTIDLGTIEVFQ